MTDFKGRARQAPDPVNRAVPISNVDAAIYGSLPPAEDSAVVRTHSIHDIRPDLRQPRRVIPVSIRGEWNGDPVGMPDLLAYWHEVVESRLGRRLDVKKALQGDLDLDLDLKQPDGVVESYFKLLRLGILIQITRWTQPIDVVVAGRSGGYLIEKGERRWTTHWLLSLYVSDEYERIPTIEKPTLDVWAQAAENSEGGREPLNAIAKARQLALLIMDMYQREPGVKFDRFEDLVLPGESDRRFYAQVANGFTYPVKPDLVEKVVSATGLKSSRLIAAYRALLKIPDELWLKADEQDWSEGRIREYMIAAEHAVQKPQPPSQTSVSDQTHSLPIGKPLAEPITENVSEESPVLAKGDTVKTQWGRTGIISDIYGSMAWLIPTDGNPQKIGGQRLDTLTLLEKGDGTALVEEADIPDEPERPTATPPTTADCTQCGWTLTGDDPVAVYHAFEQHLKTCPGTPVPSSGLYVDSPAPSHVPAPLVETTTPILDDLNDPQLKAILSFLKRMAQGDEVTRVIDLTTVSRADVQKRVQQEGWRAYMGTTAKTLRDVMERVGKGIDAYLDHLDQVSEEIRERLEDAGEMRDA